MKYFFLLSFIIFGTTACVTSIEEDPSEAEGPSVSITRSMGINGSFILIGNTKDCDVRWEALRGILTHRSNCSNTSRDEVLALMTEMAFKYKKESPIRLEYIRFTSKDFRGEEERLAKMMTQSKIWNNFSRKHKKNKSNFHNKFVKKVIEKKKVFALVPVAFKRVGMPFNIDQVEITKLTESMKSRYKNKLVEKFQASDKLLIPENIKVVFKRNYQN